MLARPAIKVEMPEVAPRTNGSEARPYGDLPLV